MLPGKARDRSTAGVDPWLQRAADIRAQVVVEAATFPAGQVPVGGVRRHRDSSLSGSAWIVPMSVWSPVRSRWVIRVRRLLAKTSSEQRRTSSGCLPAHPTAAASQSLDVLRLPMTASLHLARVPLARRMGRPRRDQSTRRGLTRLLHRSSLVGVVRRVGRLTVSSACTATRNGPRD